MVIDALADVDMELVNQKVIENPHSMVRLPPELLDKIVNRPTGRFRLPNMMTCWSDHEFSRSVKLRYKYRNNMDTLVVSLADGSCQFKPFHAWNDPEFKGDAEPLHLPRACSSVIDVVFRDPANTGNSVVNEWSTPRVAFGENFVLVFKKSTKQWELYVTPCEKLEVNNTSILVGNEIVHGVFIKHVCLRVVE